MKHDILRCTADHALILSGQAVW